MEYEQALIIGKRRRADAAMALGGYVREKVTEVCAVKPAKGAGLDARDWEPVGEENFKELVICRSSRLAARRASQRFRLAPKSRLTPPPKLVRGDVVCQNLT